MSEQDGQLAESTRQWIQQEADEYFDGNWGRAAAAILEGAHAAELNPHDRWAGLKARAQHRNPHAKP